MPLSSSSHDAIITKDLNGIISSWNAGAEHIFGYKPEEAIGRPVTMLIPPGHENEEPAILERIDTVSASITTILSVCERTVLHLTFP